jgi:AcrR family transcriptional regulator
VNDDGEPAVATVAEPVEPSTQRDRILETALVLMAEGGLHGTSMRKLATACELNVATLYHYFPSKQALFTAALAHQRIDLLVAAPPDMDPTSTPGDQLGVILAWVLTELEARGDHVWRLLLGESLRGEPLVVDEAAALSDAFAEALVGWLGPRIGSTIDPHAAARIVRSTVYGCVVESLLSDAPWCEVVAQRAHDLTAMVDRRPALDGDAST